MYTVTITHTPQVPHDMLMELRPAQDQGIPVSAVPQNDEVARVTVANLDMPALMALLYRKPRAKRSDAGKTKTSQP